MAHPRTRNINDLADGSGPALAKLCGITVGTIAGLCKTGVMEALPGPLGHYDLPPNIQAFIRHRSTNKSNESGRHRKTEQETRKLTLLNDEREGQLVLIADASKLWAEYCAALRAGVTSLPGRLASQLAGMSQPAEIRGLIHGEVTELLDAAEAILGKLSAKPQAEGTVSSGSADSKSTTKPNNGRVGRRKPSATKGQRRARKVAK